jgi:hypothetical protein
VSYDLEIWSVDEPSVSEIFSPSDGWVTKGSQCLYQSETWGLIIGPSDRVLTEDVPPEILNALPGISYLTPLHLSPISASETARQFALRAAAAITKRVHGAMFDPQTGAIALSTGVVWFMSRGPDKNARLIKISWWFTGGPLAEKRYDLLLDVFEAELKEALPRRYGTFEPPEFLYADKGRNDFLKFLKAHLGTWKPIAWYPTLPVAIVHLAIPETIGASKLGFRAGHLEVSIDASALTQPGWETALSRFWRRTSLVVCPFYGDVRTLSGYRRSRGRFMVTGQTAQHPVCSWWWGGLPAGPAHAIVLGEPYRSLWDSFVRNAQIESGLAFADAENWGSPSDILDTVGPVPSDLTQIDAFEIEHPGLVRVGKPIPTQYPARWPFGPPRNPYVK